MKKKYFINTLFLLIGVLVGYGGTWFSFHTSSYVSMNTKLDLRELLSHANVIIDDKNYSCEDQQDKTVKSVISSILHINNTSKINKINYGCAMKSCYIYTSYCNFWQTECGDKFLKFELNDYYKIRPSSFSCIDVP